MKYLKGAALAALLLPLGSAVAAEWTYWSLQGYAGVHLSNDDKHYLEISCELYSSKPPVLRVQAGFSGDYSQLQVDGHEVSQPFHSLERIKTEWEALRQAKVIRVSDAAGKSYTFNVTGNKDFPSFDSEYYPCDKE
ncbi:hypothetical protein [Gibbsiella quercinecans]|uniref:hypothetical protein n=1 Tax=Gibbsiella quercinecans TaxID=929813 RepID=UPI003A4D37A1